MIDKKINSEATVSYPLPAHLETSALIAWHMSSWCNYSCTYCPVLIYHKRSKSGPLQDHAFDHYPVERWLELFGKFPQEHIHLNITGGEPFLDRENFRETLRGLTALQHFTVRIDTNGSWDPRYFQDLDKKRIHLNIAFHPNEVDFNTYFRRVREIRDAGFDVAMLNFVLAPENLDTFEKTLHQVERAGFFVNLSPMNPTGAYLSRSARSAAEMEIIENYNLPLDVKYKVGNPQTKGRMCFFPSLSYYLMFDGRIQVFCTGGFQDVFTDGIPQLPREAVPCPYDKCIGCTEMYRALADEPLITTPLSLAPREEYVREVTAYRRARRWRNIVRKLPFGEKLTGRSESFEPQVPFTPSVWISPDAVKPALPAEPLFGSIDINGGSNGSLQARSRDRVALSGWAASRHHGAPLKEVRLLLGDRELGVVRDFYIRADVAETFQRTELSQCGWRTMVYLPALEQGDYRLAAHGIAPDGARAELASVALRIIE